MNQEIKNQSEVGAQVNIGDNKGDIFLGQKSRLYKRFEKLNQEVASNSRYEGVREDLERYITKMDGIGMSKKLTDGGFSSNEILKAAKRKQQYAKKAEKNRFYESAQWIDSQLFALIIMNFETHVESLFESGASKDLIMKALFENVIDPVLQLINREGEMDEVLNYNAEDVFGMVYYLTGMCHLNWKKYDIL
jgi:hypothetical protein